MGWEILYCLCHGLGIGLMDGDGAAIIPEIIPSNRTRSPSFFFLLPGSPLAPPGDQRHGSCHFE